MEKIQLRKEALADILLQLASSITGASGGNIEAAQTGGGGTVFSGAVSILLNNQAADPNKPKAFLNWVLMDERLNSAPGSNSEPVGNSDEFKYFPTGYSYGLEHKMSVDEILDKIEYLSDIVDKIDKATILKYSLSTP